MLLQHSLKEKKSSEFGLYAKITSTAVTVVLIREKVPFMKFQSYTASGNINQDFLVWAQVVSSASSNLTISNRDFHRVFHKILELAHFSKEIDILQLTGNKYSFFGGSNISWIRIFYSQENKRPGDFNIRVNSEHSTYIFTDWLETVYERSVSWLETVTEKVHNHYWSDNTLTGSDMDDIGTTSEYLTTTITNPWINYFNTTIEDSYWSTLNHTSPYAPTRARTFVTECQSEFECQGKCLFYIENQKTHFFWY